MHRVAKPGAVVVDHDGGNRHGAGPLWAVDAFPHGAIMVENRDAADRWRREFDVGAEGVRIEP